MARGGFDLRLRNPCSILLAGVSQSGKTTFAFNLLRSIDKVFQDPRCKQNIIFYYNIWQHSYERFKKERIVKDWINHLPTVDELKEITEPFVKKGGSIIIFDDFAEALTKDVLDCFTILCNHTKSVVILMSQNLFSKNKYFRGISLNSTYIVLFKMVRDKSQIVNFAKQFAKGKTQGIVEAFEEATKRPYTYMLFDSHMMSSDEIRVRSNILPHEGHPVVWRRRR